MAAEEISTNTTLILATQRGTSGIYVSGIRLLTVEQFFESYELSKWGFERFYTIKANGQPMELLTKKRLREEFPYFADTEVFKAIMKRKYMR